MTNRTGTTALSQIPMWLAIIGAVNWGLVGIFNWDLVRAILGGETGTPASALSRAVYALVGVAGVALAVLAPRLRSQSPAADLANAARARV